MRRSVRDTEFSEYVAGRRRQLRRTAYLLCGDSHRAEDLVQTTLMKVYVAWPRIRTDGGNVDAFARRVMVNAHIDETRRPWRRERVGVEETARDLRCSTGTVKSQTSHALRRLEQALSPHYDERQGR